MIFYFFNFVDDDDVYDDHNVVDDGVHDDVRVDEEVDDDVCDDHFC
jgi:hypothetical protein